MTALRRPLLRLRGGVIVHRPTCSVALLLRRHEEVAPTVERALEAGEDPLHYLGSVRVAPGVPRRKLRRKLVLEEVQYTSDAHEGLICHALLAHWSAYFGLQRPCRIS